MRQFFILVAIFFISATGEVIAQTKTAGSVKGTLVDSVSNQNLKSATVSILNPADSSLIVYGLSKEDGSFLLPNVPFGTHIMYVTFQGYVEVERRFTLSADSSEFNAGRLFMVALPADLGTVTVRTSPITIKGDTTEFKASMFATKPNSTAEDLLKKMPGVEVEKDGSIKAQGQNVTRVMVDGKRFFGDDPTLATRNLPTDMIDKIQVIDAQSDQSAFSGFDDGNRQTTINIITKKDRRKGVFGKAALAGGNDLRFEGDHRYAANVNMSHFNGNRQLSFIGQANNNNNQNFSAQDILGSGGGGNFGGGQRGGGGGGNFRGGGGNFGGGFSTGPTGFTKTWAAGLNYNDVWSKKTSANGSYFYNNQNRLNNTDRFTENFVTGGLSRFTSSNSFSNNKNSNNRFNFEIEHRFDTNNLIRIRPYFSQQQTDNFSQTTSATTSGKTNPLNDARVTNNSESKGHNFNNNILFQHRFAKRGRTISFNFNHGSNTNESIRKTLNINNTFAGGSLRRDTVDQISNTDRDSKFFGGTISYTEPIGRKGRLELNYYYNSNENNSDQKTRMFNPKTGQYDSINLRQSNNVESDIIDNRFSLNYQRQISQVFNYTVGLGVQNSDRTVNNRTLKTLTEQSLNNFTPTFQLQYRKDRSMNIRLNYRGNTQQPDVSQLQEVIDESNRLRITTGNPDLRQSFSNNINLFFSKFSPVTFRNIVIGVNGSMTMNSIGNQIFQNNDSVTVTLDNGVSLLPNAQFIRPINRNGGYNMGGFFNYGFPLKNPKSNINLSTNINYTRSVNTITSVTRSNNTLAGAAAPSFTNNYVLGQTVRFTMNVKERLDLNFSSRSTYNIAQYSELLKGGTTQTTNNNFFTEVISVEPTFSTKGGFIIAQDFDYNLSRGQAEGFNQSFAMWNASIAQLLFKKRQGEIRFTIYDLLNQNRSITRNIQANYIEDTRTDVLRRYFMLTFTYNLRRFGGAGQQQGNNPMRERFRGGEGGGGNRNWRN